MLNEVENISKASPVKRNYKNFIDSVIQFTPCFIRQESQNSIINLILNTYLKLPRAKSASLYLLDHETYEFNHKHSVGKTNSGYTSKIFEDSLNRGVVAKLLEKGELIEDIYEDLLDVYLFPLISPAGVMGIIMLIAKKTAKKYDEKILNYCKLHTNQMVFLLHNSKLDKDIYNLEDKIEQKIAAKLAKIKQSKRDIQLILDSILVGVLIIEKKSGIIIDVNYAALNLIGVQREEIIGTKREKWHLGEIKNIHRLNTLGDNHSEETILIDGGNNHIPILRTQSNLLIGNKDIYIESLIDITDRKKTEEEIKSQSKLLKGVAEASSILLTESNFEESINDALDLLGQITKVNRVAVYKNEINEETSQKFAVLKYKWGKENSEELDQHITKLSYDNQLKGLWEILVSDSPMQSKSDRSNNEIYKFIGSNSFLIIPIKIENELWGFISFQDTAQKREWSEAEESILMVLASSVGGAIQKFYSNQKLIEAKEKAFKSDKLKSEFLAQVSHEIRTPINSILSFASILKDEFEDKLTEDLASTFKIMGNAGNRIIRTIDLILNMSELQTGIYEYNPTEFNLYEEVILPIHDEFSKIAKTKNIAFTVTNQYGVAQIKADKYSISQIFNNLADNAVKFTKNGGVSINLKRHITTGSLTVEVCDTGIGISNEYLPDLYNPFSQEDQGYTRKYEGNGLGLALIKKYCEMNDLSIHIESEKGIGSKFTVVFPK